jgi:hypothetical protein
MPQIQIRRDTAANWASVNPTPAQGEMCYEVDSGVLKIGDGATSYTALAAFSAGGGGGGGGLTLEQVQDDLGNTSLVAGTGLTKTYNDGANTITLAIDTSAEAERARDVIGAALVAGTNVTITPNDGADTITISASLATGYTTFDVVQSTAGVWPSRPAVDVVFWVAGTDMLATTPAAATGDDIVSLASDFATSAQGALADGALQRVAGGASVEDIGAVESNVRAVAATGSTETLDTSAYGVFDMTMDEACTFTFSNPAPSGKATIFTLILRGAFTPTLPASVDWGDATAPTYTSPSVYTFMTVDAGTNWLGAQVGKAFG